MTDEGHKGPKETQKSQNADPINLYRFDTQGCRGMGALKEQPQRGLCLVSNLLKVCLFELIPFPKEGKWVSCN